MKKNYFIRIETSTFGMDALSYKISYNCPHIMSTKLPPCKGTINWDDELYKTLHDPTNKDTFVLKLLNDIDAEITAVTEIDEAITYYFRM